MPNSITYINILLQRQRKRKGIGRENDREGGKKGQAVMIKAHCSPLALDVWCANSASAAELM